MATTALFQFTFARQSGLPENAVVNTWHARLHTSNHEADAGTFADRLINFYQTIDGSMSGVLNGECVIKAYDLEDPTPRAPIFGDTQTFTMSAGAILPSEVAVCLSYRAASLSGAIQARRRGRIFIGPLATSVLGVEDDDSRVAGAFITTLEGAAVTLQGANDPLDASWVVFSPTTAGAPPWTEAEIENASFTVVGGFIDNAFDTVRSRGADATSRTEWGT